MKHLLSVTLMLGLAQAAQAQQLQIDPIMVRACFANTQTGAVYPSCLGQASNQCQQQPGGSTTVGMVECITSETAEWDAILNEEYQATQALLAQQDADGLSRIMDLTDALRAAQRAWITFRDADCTAQYALWQDGTIRSIVGANCHLTMTASRAIALRDMRGY
jgi:uncharacterized protein YecT (DUF1311 family)